MNIGISKQGESIVTVKDYSNVDSRGEIAHVIAELESIKLDLVELWETYKESDSEE